jgi:hypothetical protein
MTFYDYLVKQYGFDSAIFFGELSFKEYSLPWIKKELAKLCKEGKVCRFEKGVYYLPTETIFGKSILDPREILIKKYITNGNEVYGYFSGITFRNMLRLSTQMPNTLEVYTNKEKTRVKEITIGSLKYILRCSRTTVNRENAATMSFLELMNSTEGNYYDVEKREIVKEYIKKNRITRGMVASYAPYFPDKAMRTLVESEIVYNLLIK